MSSDASVNLRWGDGTERKYRLAYGEIEELQERCARRAAKKDGSNWVIGPLGIWKLMVAGEWLIGDIFHTLRLGLIGGGMEGAEAGLFLERYFGKHPMADVKASASVLAAYLEGEKDDDPLPKQKRQGKKKTATAPGASTSAASTE